MWRAPFRGRVPINLRAQIPGSKSVTNRALILASIAASASNLRKPLVSRDTELMVAGLRKLGVGIVESKGVENELIWTVTPQPFRGSTSIDVGNAGTVMRFLPPVAALASGPVSFDGDQRSHERPLGPVISALESLGVVIEHQGKYKLPITILNQTGLKQTEPIQTGLNQSEPIQTGLKGGVVEIDASSSSQFISALMLIGPATINGLTIRDIGKSLPSMPHINMTIQMLRDFGATITEKMVDGKREWDVAPGGLMGRDLVIEPDLSNAGPFMAMAMACGGSITIEDWPNRTTQPGDQLREIFSRMGAEIELKPKSDSSSDLKISGSGIIQGINVDLHEVGELTPIIAALAAIAVSPSTLTGIGHLRLHETDRLSALTNEINALGGNVREEETALYITPSPLHGGIFHTYDDHRLATAGAVLGLVVDGIEIENIETTRKTLPNFAATWQNLLNESYADDAAIE